MKPIQFYRPTLPPLEEYEALLAQIWQSRMLSNFAEFCGQLEGLASSYLDVPYVKALVSADIGMILTLKALDLPEQSPCFLSDFTFNSTINAALWAKLRPVIVDIDRQTFCIDAVSLRRAIKRHPGAGVILVTHVFGNPCDTELLQTIAKENGCYLIFDAAHAYGSLRDNTKVGGFGDAEVFSLSGTKLVTSAEGGLVATRHSWLAEKLAYLRAYGFQHDYNSRYVGLNGKISELHCALAVLSLQRIEPFITERLKILKSYQDRLQESVSWQHVRPQDRSTYKDISIGLGNARALVEEAFKEDGIQFKRYFLPLHHMKLYSEFAEDKYSATEHVYETTLCIPAYSDLTSDDLDRISRCILKGIR